MSIPARNWLCMLGASAATLLCTAALAGADRAKPPSQASVRQQVLELVAGSSAEHPVSLYDNGLRKFKAADLSGIDFNAASLRAVQMPGVDLSNADLSQAVLSLAIMPDADLSGANLSDAQLYSVLAPGANFKGADLSGARVIGHLQKSNFEGADLSGLRAGVVLANQSMGMLNAKFDQANLSGVDLSGADLSYASLRFADLSGANLSNANLTRADLSGANLKGANLTGAVVTNAILASANLTGAIMKDIEGAETIVGSKRIVGWQPGKGQAQSE